MTDLAAIVARDAVTTYPTAKAQLNAALQAVQDRRALLALLRETREALAIIAAEDDLGTRQSINVARRNIAALALKPLAALDTEVLA